MSIHAYRRILQCRPSCFIYSTVYCVPTENQNTESEKEGATKNRPKIHISPKI